MVVVSLQFLGGMMSSNGLDEIYCIDAAHKFPAPAAQRTELDSITLSLLHTGARKSGAALKAGNCVKPTRVDEAGL